MAGTNASNSSHEDEYITEDTNSEPMTAYNIPDLDNATTSQLDEGITWAINYYRNLDPTLSPYNIWGYLVDDFAEWKHRHFNRAAKASVRGLREVLRNKGVYVTRMARFAITEAIMETISSPDFPTWPDDDTERPVQPSSSPLPGPSTTKPTTEPTPERPKTPQPEVIMAPKAAAPTATQASEETDIPHPVAAADTPPLWGSQSSNAASGEVGWDEKQGASLHLGTGLVSKADWRGR